MSGRRFRVSDALKLAVWNGRRYARRYQYAIAAEARMNPGTLSKLLSGEPVRENDVRVRKIARAVGLDPALAFEEIGAAAEDTR